MSNKKRLIGRAAIIGLMLGVAPLESAIGQEAQPAVAPQAATAPEVDPAGIVSAAAINELETARLRIEAEAKEARELEKKAAVLKPGAFLWTPDRSPSGEVEVVVSIAEQKAYVFRADKLIESPPCRRARGATAPHRDLHDPAEEPPALLQHLQQRAHAQHAAADLARHRASCRRPARLSGQPRLHPAADGILQDPVRGDPHGRAGAHRGGTPATAADALAYATGRRGAPVQVASAS
jgi:hypothetical protein